MLALPDPPTAVFTGQNLLTIGGVHALRKAGLQDRIALVGFDDVPLSDVVEPAISVVAQDPQELGRTAAELLVPPTRRRGMARRCTASFRSR